MRPDKEHILSEIQRTAEENQGKPLGRQKFEKETGIKESDWSGNYWTKWSDAVSEAGYKPNLMQSALPPEHLLRCMISIIQELGHFPTVAELRLKSRTESTFPSHNTFARLGRKGERAQRVIEYCSTAGDLDDVIAACEPYAEPISDLETTDGSIAVENFGFVYLMKSGKYYKIGRSVSAEKRAYELQLQLPEELKLVHKIKTDDPVGIEAYWHGRFADKRQRGEWFDLSSQDVNVFRRRKFM